MKQKNKDKIIFLSSLIIMFLIGIMATMCVYRFVPNKTQAVNGNTSNIKITEADSINSSVEKIDEAVIYIETNGGSGTGFFYKTDQKYAYIITNYHVVEDAKNIEITNITGKSYSANLQGYDEFADIAVLTVDKEAATKIVEIGKSSESKRGDTVFAIGSPLGKEYMNSVSKGIVSGKDRTIEVKLSSGAYLMEVIQTDAAINPGNSGGPLCNINGEVIGVNSLKLVESEIEGMGFAIPIEYVMSVVSQVESGEKVAKPYLGVEFINVGDTWQLYRNGIIVNKEVEYGVVISNVVANMPADKAGLKKGDVIIEFAGEKVESMAYLRYLLYKQSVNDKVEVKYYRNNKIEETTITLSEAAK